MYYAGLDLHKRYCTLCVLTSAGEVVLDHRRLPADLEPLRRSLWVVVAGLLAHGVFDAIHDQLITNPGVPVWWPQFCLTYDVVAAGYLASLLLRRAVPAHAP
jgi:hypothetical protein